MALTFQGHLGEESLSLALGSAQANCVVPILQSFRGLSDTHRYPCPPPLPTACIGETAGRIPAHPTLRLSVLWASLPTPPPPTEQR